MYTIDTNNKGNYNSEHNLPEKSFYRRKKTGEEMIPDKNAGCR